MDKNTIDKLEDKPPTSTKKCSNCGNERLLLLDTYNTKLCTDCDNKLDWYREEGQESRYG